MCSIENADCLDAMKEIAGGSVNLILTDLPYGVTNSKSEAGKWDCPIPMEPLWENFLRVTKENAAIILFGQGKFFSDLVQSKRDLFRYDLIWVKCRASGFLNSQKMPLRAHENIGVFYRELPTYNIQYVECKDSERTHSRGKLTGKVTNTCYGKRNEVATPITNKKFPTSVLVFPKPAPTETVHPTQKPVDLLRWLIRSFSNPGDMVLDATMGSGSTGVAAILEGRSFIGIEKEKRYFDIAKKRIEMAENTPVQGELGI